MPVIRITVVHDQRPLSGYRVALGYDGIFGGGVTEYRYTNADGRVEFDSEYGQGGDVYVEGSHVARWSSYTATDITVQL